MLRELGCFVWLLLTSCSLLYDGPTQLRWTILTSVTSSAALQELCLFDLPMLGCLDFLYPHFIIEVQQCLPWHQRTDT